MVPSVLFALVSSVAVEVPLQVPAPPAFTLATPADDAAPQTEDAAPTAEGQAAPASDEPAEASEAAEPTHAPSPAADPEPTTTEQTPSTGPTASCPCTEADWQCRQAYVSLCSHDGSRAAPSTDASGRTKSKSDARAKETPWAREGLLIGAGLGYLGCETDECIAYRGGAAGQLELGYRFGRFAPLVGIDLGGGPLDEDRLDDLRGTGRLLGLGAGVMIMPVLRARFDPYFGARVGLARSQMVLEVPLSTIGATITYERLGVRVTAGLGYSVTRHISVGPRFDMTIPFGGRICSHVYAAGYQDANSCIEVSEILDSYRSELPRWWSMSVAMHVVIPGVRRKGASRR